MAIIVMETEQGSIKYEDIYPNMELQQPVSITGVIKEIHFTGEYSISKELEKLDGIEVILDEYEDVGDAVFALEQIMKLVR